MAATGAQAAADPSDEEDEEEEDSDQRRVKTPDHTQQLNEKLRNRAARTRTQVGKKRVAKGGTGVSEVATERRDSNSFLHKVFKEKDEATRALLKSGLQHNRFCSSLPDKEIEVLIDAMEYFTFVAGQEVVTQGENGRHFFVTTEGTLEVIVDGKVINTLGPGQAFGAIALLYDCPRTATVMATTETGVWGADGEEFRRVLKAYTETHHEENKKFLDCVTFFDGLSAAQKERVAAVALVTECFEAGARVVTEGEVATAVYVVKKGSLQVWAGSQVDSTGQLVGGNCITHLGVGSCFGERAVIYGETRTSTVVAEGHCELVAMGVQDLRKVLGKDLATILERSLVLSALQKMPIVSHLSLSQRHTIAEASERKFYNTNEALDIENLQMLIVIDGEVVAKGVADEVVTLKRGEWYADDKLVENGKSSGSSKGVEKSSARKKCSVNGSAPEVAMPHELKSLATGDHGAKLAILTRETLSNVLKEIGITQMCTADEAVETMRKVLLARKVPIFRELSERQVDALVASFVVRKYRKGAAIIQQGDIGDAFYIISAGEVNVCVDGEKVRVLGRNSCFGERALLFDERRTATVEAASDNVETWSVHRESFDAVVSEGMRTEIMRRIKMQDTSVTMRTLNHVQLIGAGSFGSVRLVEHKFTGLRYALKRIKKGKDGEIPKEVQRECEVLGGLDHPFILRMIATFETKSSVYILTELVTGGNLFDALDRIGTTLTKKQTQFYAGSLCLVLEFIHDQHIVFRDLKPENVMLDAQGYVKLIDFGLAKKIRVTGRTYTACGTLFYMAPEVILGKGHGMGVDVWSLGVMIFDMVNGFVPFGDGLEDEQAILEAILQEEMQFGEHYTDPVGQKLMKGLTKKNPLKRLGAGVNGWEEIKKHKYFCGKDNLFDKIMAREVEPPLAPGSKEYYSDEKELETTTLSDADQLGDGDD